MLFDVFEIELEPYLGIDGANMPLLELPTPLTEPLGRGGQSAKGSISSKLVVDDAPMFACFSVLPNWGVTVEDKRGGHSISTGWQDVGV